MNEPRLQHYLPKFYLEGFRNGPEFRRFGRNIIYVYEPRKPQRRSSPAKEARQRDIYTLAGVERRFQIEEHLANIECATGEIIPKLRDKRYRLTTSDKEGLAWFVGSMIVRTPAALRYQREIVGPALGVLVERLRKNRVEFEGVWRQIVAANPNAPTSDQVFEEFRRAKLEGLTLPNAELRGMMSGWSQSVHILRNSGWEVLHASKHEDFITSDYPVITGKPLGPNISWGYGIGWPDTESYFSLTSKLCLRIGQSVRTGVATIRSKGVRLINGYLMQYANRFLYAASNSSELATDFNQLHGAIKFGENALVPNFDLALELASNQYSRLKGYGFSGHRAEGTRTP